MNKREGGLAAETTWDKSNVSRIPFWVYTDEGVYKKELERLFYSGHWSYVALDAELPNPGDFKLAMVGERSVIVLRSGNRTVNVLENVCAHRGTAFCREQSGNTKTLTCPYHQWSYNLDGNLVGVPFRRGLKQNGIIKGGMPEDFNPAEHGLKRLKVASRNGVIFASFDHDVDPLEDYLGPAILEYFDRVFNGRKLKVHGYSRQRIPGNWKLVQENLKDPYHAGLLHSWFVTFGLYRGDQISRTVLDSHGRHSVVDSSRNSGTVSGDVERVASFKRALTLNDDRILDIVKEDWWGKPTLAIITIFPNLIIQQQSNSMTTRTIVPRGPHAFDFVFTDFGFEEDSAEMTTRRLRQANLFGPAGFVWADDGEVIGYCQRGYRQDANGTTLMEQGGRDFGPTDHTITEGLIRGMYAYWRKVMEI